MSSIFGIVNLNGAAVHFETLQLMNRRLSYRQEGPLQTGIWGNVGFGIRPNKAYTAEGENFGTRAITGPVVADARLDNRCELCSQLGLDERSSTATEIIARAFAQWGESCTDHLLGDFAFAVFDKSKNRLFCARDHFGVRPFYYTRTKQCIAFATDPRAITALDKEARPLSEDAMLDYILGYFPHSAKFYLDGILKLPPAHHLLVERGKVATHQYWRLRPDSAVWNMAPEEAAERFRELFKQAAESRLGPRNRTATFLSGGLDSSSVTALAVQAARARGDDRPVQSFASVFPDVPEADESDWIGQVVDFLNRDGEAVQLHVSGGEDSGPLRRVVEMTEVLGEPVLAPNQYFTWDMVTQAACKDVDVILTGHDGDSVVGHAMYQLTNHAVEGRFGALDDELDVFLGMLVGYSNARRRLLISHAGPAVGIAVRRLQFLRAFHLLQTLHRRYGLSRKAIVQQSIPQVVQAALTSFRRKYLERAFLKDSAAMRWRLFRRRLAHRARWEDRAELQHLDYLKLNAISASFETFDRVGAAHGIELRHPFFDKRLVEFCVSLPVSAKVRDGYSRWVLRHAMSGALPDGVRLRKTKADLSSSFVKRLAKDSAQIQTVLRSQGAKVYDFLNVASLDTAAGQLDGTQSERVSLQIHMAICAFVYANTKKGDQTDRLL